MQIEKIRLYKECKVQISREKMIYILSNRKRLRDTYTQEQIQSELQIYRDRCIERYKKIKKRNIERDREIKGEKGTDQEIVRYKQIDRNIKKQRKGDIDKYRKIQRKIQIEGQQKIKGKLRN